MQLSKETKTDEDIRYSEWQEPYQQALIELDQKKLRERHSCCGNGNFQSAAKPLLAVRTITLSDRLLTDALSSFAYSSATAVEIVGMARFRRPKQRGKSGGFCGTAYEITR